MFNQSKLVSLLLFIIVINLTLVITVAPLIKCSSHDNAISSSLSTTWSQLASKRRGYYQLKNLIDSAPVEGYLPKRAFYRFIPRLARIVAPKPSAAEQMSPLANRLISTSSLPIAGISVVASASQSRGSVTVNTVQASSSTINQVNESQKMTELTANGTLKLPRSLEPLLGISSSSSSSLPTVLSVYNNPKITVDKLKVLQTGAGAGSSNSNSNSSTTASPTIVLEQVLDSLKDIVGSLSAKRRTNKCEGHEPGTCTTGPSDTDKLLPLNNNHSDSHQHSSPAAITVAIANKQSRSQQQDPTLPVIVKHNVTIVVVPSPMVPPTTAAAAAVAAAAVVVAADITGEVLNEKKVDDVSDVRLGQMKSLSASQWNDVSSIKKRSSSSQGEKVHYKVDSLPAPKLDANSIVEGRGMGTINSLIRTAVSGDKMGELYETSKSTSSADMTISGEDSVSQQQQRQSIRSFIASMPAPTTIDANGVKSIITQEQFAEILSSLNANSTGPIQASIEMWLKKHKGQKSMSFMHFG